MTQPSHTNLSTLPLSKAQQRMLDALARRRFFKLIGGGSFTETEKIAHLAKSYAMAGVDCIDLAPDFDVLSTVETVLSVLPQPHPVLMVSLPLDPDPHFRKIELAEADCIRCGLCLPVCPTEALTLPEALEISQSLCYGCGRCVPTCPTDALSLLPFQVENQVHNALSHPLVEAVEIHSQYVDPFMLDAFFQRWHLLLQNKLIALCFRVDTIPAEQIIRFYQTAQAHSRLPVLLQIDGAPMSGNDDPEASRPALDAAAVTAELFEASSLPIPIITISGGINRHTAQWLQQERYQFIAGVGMGTVARKATWSLSDSEAIQVATDLMSGFKAR